ESWNRRANIRTATGGSTIRVGSRSTRAPASRAVAQRRTCRYLLGTEMYGLPSHADLSFFCGRRLEQIALGDHQVQLRFDGDVTVDLEGDFTRDSATGGARDGHRLHVLLGTSVARVERKGK